MCTIILAHNVNDDAPLLLGANRDERYGRPAAPPKVFNDRALRVLAPQDLEAGGTWLGINEAGVLAAITNRFGAQFPDERRSRGELVFRALEQDSVDAATDVIAELDPTDYNGFHLVVASSDAARIVWGDGERMCASSLPTTGVTVVTERSFGAARNRRKRRVSREVDELIREGRLDVHALADVLSSRPEGGMDDTCVVMDEIEYGTRCATILSCGTNSSMFFADGPPCSTEFKDESELLRSLFMTG